MQIERPVRVVTITLENEYEIDLFNQLLQHTDLETLHYKEEDLNRVHALEKLWNRLSQATNVGNISNL